MAGEGKGDMTVSEAARRGGERTAESHDHRFYERIGRKGGQKVEGLIERGKKEEAHRLLYPWAERSGAMVRRSDYLWPGRSRSYTQ